MSPEERNLVIELFDRLATLEDAQRDPEAERLIRDGLRQAPNAPYALVQTALVQDEALKRANARIQELEAATAADTPVRDTSFLGGMRDSLLGRRGSVPSVRPNEGAPEPGMSPAWRTTGAPGPAPGYAPAPGYGPEPGYGGSPGYGGAPGGGAPMQQGGGSFLGTAAATAAGMVGGSLLMGGIRNLMGGSHGSAHAAFDPSAGGSPSPWSGGASSAAGGALSRDAGLDDIGRTTSSRSDSAGTSQGLLGGGRDDAAADRVADDPHADDLHDSDLDDNDLDDSDDFDGGDDGEE
jgi:uncharacterized protein